MYTSTTSPPERQADLRLRRRRLRLRRRQEGLEDKPASSSLFARLSTSAVNHLNTDALCRAQALGESIQTERWNISSQQGLNRVEFLPLSIKFSADLIIYVSYNGGEAVEGKDGDTIELPAFMIPPGVSENSEVQVAALPSVRDANVLNVEPLTVEDWELLETRAEFLEEGALLRQVSVVYAEQKLPLWVGGKDVAWIKVLAENFGEHDSVWPQTTPFTTEEACCVRLVENTRFCVVPKPKTGAGRGLQVSPPLRVYPTMDDYLKPMIDLADLMGKRQVCTTPGTCFAHSDTLDLIPGWNPGDETGLAVLWNTAHDQRSSIVVQIAPCDDVPGRCIAIHRLTRSRLDLVALVDSVHLRLMSPVEVARGATMFTQTSATERRKLSLERVRIQEARLSQHWRYPYEQSCLDCPCSASSAPSSAKQHGSLYASEPVQVGSFLYNTPLTDHPCGRQSLFRLRWNYPPETLSSSSSSSEQCFISFCELAKLIRPFSEDNATGDEIADAETTYELRYTSQLQNLLPLTSFVPCELSGENLGSLSLHDAIVTGDSGSGKTHTALVLAAYARFATDCSTHYLDCKKLKEGRGIRMRQILSELHKVFHEATSSEGNSLVILDDLDELTPNFEGGVSSESSAQSHLVNPSAVDQSKLIADTIRLLIETSGCGQRVSIIVTCRECVSLPSSVSTARPILQTVKAPTLTADEREQLLWHMICEDGIGIANPPTSEFGAVRVGRKTEGFRPRDLQIVAFRVKQMLHVDGTQNRASALAKYTELVLESYTPMRLLSSSQAATSPIEWSDIGGLFQVKEDLATTILNPAKYRRIYDKAKIRLPRGVMVFGSPGCGKSYLVPALAKKCGFSLITCRGPELLDRYIGASETKVRELFARAKASAPSILFFDEIDSLAPRRGSDKTGVTDRVVNQLLTLLDGVEDVAAGGLVYIVAATSRPDIVDPALLRPGRLEKHIYVGYPETDREFIDLLVKVASRYPVDTETMQLVSSGQLLQELYKFPYLRRLSAADLKAAFDTAQLSAIHELLQTDAGSVNISIGRRHLITAIEQTRPSLPERDYSTLMEIYRPFRKDVHLEHPEDDALPNGTKAHPRRKELRTALR